MASSSKSNNVYHIRCISLPSGSYPNTLQIEDELNKLKTLEASLTASAEKIYNSLTRLENLYMCVNDLLSSPLTQQALSHHRNEKWVDELLDQSMRLVDVCGFTRDVMLLAKEQVRDLQSTLRRRKGDSCIEGSIAKYTSFRRKMKTDAKRLVAALKQIDSQIGGALLLEPDHQLLVVIRVLREVSAVSVSIFRSLLLSSCVPVSKPKPSKWLIVSKLIHKGATDREDLSQISNELKSVECNIEGIENGLESTFRSLIKARTSLLNIMSQ